MGMDCTFSRRKAEDAGVSFTQLHRQEVNHSENCGELHGGWCDCGAPVRDLPAGEIVECPNGAKGFAALPNLFQCGKINQEILDWFLVNVPGTKVSV